MRDPSVQPTTPDVDLEKIWRDPEQLRDWTFGMLLEIHEPHPGSSWEAWARDDAEAKRVWLNKLRRDDPIRFAKLITRHHDLARLAQKRPRGRQQGQHAPGLYEAWEAKQFIQHKWREVFGHAYGHKNLALEIAAALYGFAARQLSNFGKNKTR